MKITFLYIFLSLISLTTFSQEDTVTNRKFLKHLKREAIPDDILKDGHILVIQNPYYGRRGDNKNDKENEKIKNLLDSIYKGKYILLTQETFWGVKRDTGVYKYEIDMNTTTVRGAEVKFQIIDYSKIIGIKDEKILNTAIKNTGITCSIYNYLDHLKLLIQYINQKG